MVEFLPEYSSMPRGGMHVPLFKLFSHENWKYVRHAGKPMELPSAKEAVAAAKECVKRILNPPLRAEQIEAPEPEHGDMGFADWRQRKAEEAEQERVRVFGSDAVRNKNGRAVEVVVRRVGR